MNKNEKKLKDKNHAETAKLNRNKATYFKDLKTEQEERKKQNFDFISNEEINSCRGSYTEYIYDIFSFDSIEERLKWLNDQEDFGKLIIYDKILNDFYVFFYPQFI